MNSEFNEELFLEAWLTAEEGYRPPPDILDPKFKLQTDFIRDTSKLKALFCTRRASKSYTGGLGVFTAGLELPGCNTLYLGLTRLSTKAIVWKDVLKEINRRHSLDATFNETELTVTLPNGSMIYVAGADSHEDEMEKLLGKKYRRVVIDEAASWTVDMHKLVYGVLKPTVIDQGGDIWLVGTSGNLTKGLFFDITTGTEPGWKLFQWTAYDNPYVARQWHEEIEDIKANRPLFMETPLFKQWYLNQWYIDEEKLVYRFNREKNQVKALPHFSRGEWSYVLGVDLGFDDASAFVVTAFHEFDKNLYVVESFKKAQMDITDVANAIKRLTSKYNTFKVVVDGANKQAVKEMQNRHGLGLTAADKTGKSDFIDLMNSEFIQARIKLIEQANDELITEYLGLIWDEKKLEKLGKREEHPNCDNHLCDAALYAWRFCYQWLSEAPAEKPDPRDKAQWLAHTKKLMDDSLEKQIQDQQARERGDDIFNLASVDSETDVLSYYLNKRRGNR